MRPAATASTTRRLRLVVETLTGSPAPSSLTALAHAFENVLADASTDAVWLALAVLSAALPSSAEVMQTRRRLHLDGTGAAFGRLLRPTLDPFELRRRGRAVEVVNGGVLVDLEHTSHTSLATGIQRVARMTAQVWTAEHTPLLVGWTADQTALRRLAPGEAQVALHGGDLLPGQPATTGVVIPWHSTYLLPELAVEEERLTRILALAAYSGSRTGSIGFDCVPVSSGETTGPGIGSGFARSLSATRHFDRVAAISHAAAAEYRGWRRMLAGSGVPGPQIDAVPLPAVAAVPSPEALGRVNARFDVDRLPMVLVVGSHEPRKNHEAVLQAAELAWQRGLQFTLLFVGGNSWSAGAFEQRLADLASRGRPVVNVRQMSDADLWAAYRLARCVLFPSLNEGFGLPVAEALASGTPVITSRFGSMAEIAQGGGALLVDPRDDADLSAALVAVLEDDQLHARLAQEAQGRTDGRTWTTYARTVWDLLVDGSGAA